MESQWRDVGFIRTIGFGVAALIPVLVLGQAGISTEPAVALLSQKCLACHNDKQLSSGLSVETRTSVLTGGNRGAAIVPGKPQDSLMVAAIRQSGALKMPPGGKLTDTEIGIIERWIAGGAPGLKQSAVAIASNHWAFQAPKRPAEPSVRQAAWVRTPIDRFILARLEKEGLRPSPEADKITLLRRLHLDLTGLSPSPQEIDAFLADGRSDAFEREATGCSPRLTMGSAGAVTGLTRRGTLIPILEAATSRDKYTSIASGSFRRSTRTCHSTSSWSSSLPAICCRMRPPSR